MTSMEREKAVKEAMNWGRPNSCDICGEPMKGAKGFIHLQKGSYMHIKNHYICKDCIRTAADMVEHLDDHEVKTT